MYYYSSHIYYPKFLILNTQLAFLPSSAKKKYLFHLHVKQCIKSLIAIIPILFSLSCQKGISKKTSWILWAILISLSNCTDFNLFRLAVDAYPDSENKVSHDAFVGLHDALSTANDHNFGNCLRWSMNVSTTYSYLENYWSQLIGSLITSKK